MPVTTVIDSSKVPVVPDDVFGKLAEEVRRTIDQVVCVRIHRKRTLSKKYPINPSKIFPVIGDGEDRESIIDEVVDQVAALVNDEADGEKWTGHVIGYPDRDDRTVEVFRVEVKYTPDATDSEPTKPSTKDETAAVIGVMRQTIDGLSRQVVAIAGALATTGEKFAQGIGSMAAANADVRKAELAHEDKIEDRKSTAAREHERTARSTATKEMIKEVVTEYSGVAEMLIGHATGNAPGKKTASGKDKRKANPPTVEELDAVFTDPDFYELRGILAEGIGATGRDRMKLRTRALSEISRLGMSKMAAFKVSAEEKIGKDRVAEILAWATVG